MEFKTKCKGVKNAKLHLTLTILCFVTSFRNPSVQKNKMLKLIFFIFCLQIKMSGFHIWSLTLVMSGKQRPPQSESPTKYATLCLIKISSTTVRAKLTNFSKKDKTFLGRPTTCQFWGPPCKRYFWTWCDLLNNNFESPFHGSML